MEGRLNRIARYKEANEDLVIQDRGLINLSEKAYGTVEIKKETAT